MGVSPAEYARSRFIDPFRTVLREDRRSAWRLLHRHHDFRWYFVGSLVTNQGTWLQNTAQVLIAYQLAHSAAVVGLVVCAQFAGALLVSPWAVVLTNWLSSKTILIGTQLASLAIAAGMAWRYHSGTLDVPYLITGALGLGLLFSLALPVQMALLTRLVPPADAKAAIKMNSVSYNSGRALAPLLCVVMVAFGEPELVFALNAISFGFFAFVLARMGPITGAEPGRPLRRARVTDGIRVACQRRRILLLLAFVGAVTVAEDPILVVSPSLAHTSLHVSGGWAGGFIAALGWGIVLGSLPPTSRERADPSLTTKRAAFSLLLLSASVVVFAMGLSPQVSLAAAFVAGGAGLYTGAAAQALLLGEEEKAAVATLWVVAWAGSKPLTSLFDGWLASQAGLLMAAVLLVVPAVALALGEIMLSAESKQKIKTWTPPISWARRPELAVQNAELGEAITGSVSAYPVAGGALAVENRGSLETSLPRVTAVPDGISSQEYHCA